MADVGRSFLGTVGLDAYSSIWTVSTSSGGGRGLGDRRRNRRCHHFLKGAKVKDIVNHMQSVDTAYLNSSL